MNLSKMIVGFIGFIKVDDLHFHSKAKEYLSLSEIETNFLVNFFQGVRVIITLL